MKKPLVSVIILNWNRKEDVSETLIRLKNQTYKNFEVIVVDNASTDGSLSHFRRNFPETKIVGLDKNYGLYGWNFGMRSAMGEYLLLLASDSRIKNDLIKKHVEKLNRNKAIGVSCPATYELKTRRYLGPNRAKKGNDIKGYRVTYFDGNGICLKREVFEKTGGYDEDYFICLEELEWAVRILKEGFDIACFTDCVVYHKKSKKGGDYRKRMGFYYCRNWIWFYLKYLPLRQIPAFLLLHIKSFFIKTNAKGTMRKTDCLRGLLASINKAPKYLKKREPLSETTLERVKLDLFPNPGHLYIS